MSFEKSCLPIEMMAQSSICPLSRMFLLSLLMLVTLASVTAVTPSFAQTLEWRELSASPFVGRHNDVYFVDTETGWIVNGDGEIYRTDDGGASWTRQLRQTDSHFRSVGFLNPLRGFAGNVGVGEFGATDMFPLYETRDGGMIWTPVPAWNGRTPTGLCGMHVVNDSVVVTVGRVRGPAFFARTTDGGVTWRSKDMAGYAAGLIDVYFTSPDTGFAVGLTNVDHDVSSAVILYTNDGGQTWERRFRSSRIGEWAWKISFPTQDVGYVSLQRNSEMPIFFLKTSDGGVTWDEKLFSSSYYFVQGIGFIDENRGWIGGNSSSPVFRTIDGGDTWQAETLRPRLNRFRFLGDSLGYAVGRRVHKLADWTAVSVEEPDLSTEISLSQNYPNPFSDRTAIRYSLPGPGPVRIEVFDVLGRKIAVLLDGVSVDTEGLIDWDGRTSSGSRVAPGTYLYRLTSARATRSQVLHFAR